MTLTLFTFDVNCLFSFGVKLCITVLMAWLLEAWSRRLRFYEDFDSGLLRTVVLK